MTNSHLRRKPHTNHLLVVTADGKKTSLAADLNEGEKQSLRIAKVAD
jgi:hypothetical protein